jgi:hypothetical protein
VSAFGTKIHIRKSRALIHATNVHFPTPKCNLIAEKGIGCSPLLLLSAGERKKMPIIANLIPIRRHQPSENGICNDFTWNPRKYLLECSEASGM